MCAARMELVYFPPKQFSARFGDNFFTAVMENFERVRPVASCAGKHIVYVIAVSRGKNTWTVKRRFSEFEKLLKYLKEKYPQTVQPFPPLPPKTCFTVITDDEFLFARTKLLQVFLNELLTTLHMEKLILDTKVVDFLELQNYTSSDSQYGSV